MSGYDIVKAIRNEMEIPLLIVSAKTEDIDKIRGGFGSGADDYMTKPFSPSELVARVNTHISRYERLSHQVKKDDKLHLKGGLEIHQGSRRVLINGKEVQFTTKEFDLLLFMAQNANIVFSKEQLYDRIWGGEDDFGDTATVAVHIQKIRKKIEKNPSEPAYIETVWGGAGTE